MLTHATEQMTEEEVRRAYDLIACALANLCPNAPTPLSDRDALGLLWGLTDSPENYEACWNCNCPVHIDSDVCDFCGHEKDE